MFIRHSLDKEIPELQVSSLTQNWVARFRILIDKSGIRDFSPIIEVWSSDASNKTLSYFSHGIFRYFGKFPPPIARYLIKKYVKKGGLVIDPMCGSGTTCLEALLLNRKAICYDVSPLAVLVSKVKVTPLDRKLSLRKLGELIDLVSRKRKISNFDLTGLKNSEHWFLKETIQSLSKIRSGINEINASKQLKELFTVAFLGVVRRVSKATTQQGRLFLDVVTAEKNAVPFFEKRARSIIDSVSSLPHKGEVEIFQKSILHKSVAGVTKADLIICHPPYFNSYKYSGVNSLELAWMGIKHADVRLSEIRESFKVGRPEKVTDYVTDLSLGMLNLRGHLKKGGRLALMIGDTLIKGKYIPVTKMLLNELRNDYVVEFSALRIPKFTEASWAASQRRKGGQIGINICDFVVILKKK